MSFRKKVTIEEAVSLVNENKLRSEKIFIEPPDASVVISDEDSANEDDGGFLSNLGGRHLEACAEVDVGSDISDDNEENEEPGTSTRAGSGGNTCQPKRRGCLPVNVPPVKSAKTKEKVKKPKKVDRKWSDNKDKTKQPSKIGLFPDPNFTKYKGFSPTELFELFFDEELFEYIASQSVIYGHFINLTNVELTSNDIRLFFGVLMVSGYNPIKSRRHMWSSSDDLKNVAVHSAIRRNRFEQIMRYIHFADNAKDQDMTDKYWKLRPLIKKMKVNCLKHFVPSQNLSFDESMIEYFGRHSCKQSIRMKPIRFGYKVWSLTNTKGYLIDFDIYQGKNKAKTELNYEEKFGCAPGALLYLIDDLCDAEKDLPYHFFFDNLFTTKKLLCELSNRGFSGTGTVRENYFPSECPLLSKTDMNKKARGYHESAVFTVSSNNIVYCRWKDNGVVTAASTAFNVAPTKNVTRWSATEKKKVQVQLPFMLHQYNKNMGGTDLFNQHVRNLRVGVRGKKWWWSIFTWMVDAAVVNAWSLHKECNQVCPLLDFKRRVAMSYIIKFGTPVISGRLGYIPDGVAEDLRYDRMDHLAEHTVDKKPRRCAGEFCTTRCITQCAKCNVGLCMYCFSTWHTKIV